MLLSLGIFFLSERLDFLNSNHSGREKKTKRCGPGAKLEQGLPFIARLVPRRFPQKTHRPTFVPWRPPGQTKAGVGTRCGMCPKTRPRGWSSPSMGSAVLATKCWLTCPFTRKAPPCFRWGSPTKTGAALRWMAPSKPCSTQSTWQKPWTPGSTTWSERTSRASTLSCSATRWVAASPWRCSKVTRDGGWV